MQMFQKAMLYGGSKKRSDSSAAAASFYHIPNEHNVAQATVEVMYFDSVEGRDEFVSKFENDESMPAACNLD